MEFLDKILAFLSLAEGASVTIAVVLEFAFRLVKTDKPRSILLMVAAIAEKSGEVLTASAKFLNKVIPQRLK